MAPRSQAADARIDIGSRAVERVSQVIQCLSSSPRRGQGVQDVARHLGVSRQAASRLLDGMVRSSIAIKDPFTRRYRLSMHAYVWFRRVASERAPSETIRKEMMAIACETKSAVVYSILDGDVSLGLEEVQFADGCATLRPSTRFSPWATSLSGKMLVGLSEPQMIRDYLRSSAPISKADLIALEAELEEVRRDGYGCSHGPGHYRVVVPLKDSDDLAFAALVIIAQQGNISEDEKQRIISRALLGAARCSASTEDSDLLAI